VGGRIRPGRSVRRRLAVVAIALVAVAGFIVVRDLRRGYRSTDGAKITAFTLHSPLTRRELHEILVTPRRHTRVLLVLLHGRSSAPSSFLNQTFFDSLASLDGRAPMVLLLDGGDHSYWHDRADGKWGSMVLREAIPAGMRRTRAARVAIGGISMGGFGALAIGTGGRFCAVGAQSAALWFHAGDSAAGAFDDAEDFARNGALVAHPARYRMPVWIDVGASDPFHDADVAYAREVHAQLHVWPGGHTGAYWRAHMRQYLGFFASACA
jgi:enterochelin esterase-like enzyme